MGHRNNTQLRAHASDTCRIYVACLAAYNNGRLYGRWIEATTPDEVMAEVSDMLSGSPEPDAEEWAIHDYEGFEGVSLSEYASFETVCALAEFVRNHGELGAAVLSHFGGNLLMASEALEEQYAGEYDDLASFAEELSEGIGPKIPDSILPYVDWAAMGRDLELGGDVWTVTTGFSEVHIFWSR